MESQGPDIVVDAGGRRLLVVDVKLAGDVANATRALSQYMSRLLYPSGLLVVGREIVILRQDFGSGAIETAGPFSTLAIDALEPPTGPLAGAAYEARVQRWLVSLRDPFVRVQLPEPLRRAVADWIVPAVEAGDVRAAGPRPPLAA